MDTRIWRDFIELVGILAIVVSLLLLGYEIRQTRLAILGETYQTRAISASESNIAYANSPYLPQIDIKYAAEGLEALIAEERARFFADAQAALDRFDGLFYQYELGLITNEYYEYVLVPRMMFWKNRWQELGLLNEGTVRPSFKAAVEQIAEHSGALDRVIQSSPE